uniref:(northern house mosquito) hypothetical protein n=1 Tax=Culex pipiens TaxID=7175 RepID=A0A8D8GD68_CULPI
MTLKESSEPLSTRNIVLKRCRSRVFHEQISNLKKKRLLPHRKTLCLAVLHPPHDPFLLGRRQHRARPFLSSVLPFIAHPVADRGGRNAVGLAGSVEGFFPGTNRAHASFQHFGIDLFATLFAGALHCVL